MPDFAAQFCDLLESRLPLMVESDGSEDDWDVVGPAMLAAAGRHLRAIAHLKATFPSGVVSWQLVRSMFEYVATYASIAAEPETRAKRWLKADYQQRLKLDGDLESLGARLLDEQNRPRVSEFGADITEMPGSVIDRTTQADQAWSDRFEELGPLPEDMRSFRRLYPLIYRNASRFTHPSSHVVATFVIGNPSRLSVGDERPLERDLALVGSAVLAIGLAIATTATPALVLTLDEIREAISD
jgi:uncharacterized protein DUF5677